MGTVNRVCRRAIYILLILGLTFGGNSSALAQEEEEEPPQRQAEVVETINQYEWWLIRWTDNITVCQLFIVHQGPPTSAEVLKQCDEMVFEAWTSTPPCPRAELGRSTFSCSGLYLHPVGYRTGERTIVVDLPPLSVILTLSDCTLIPPENKCPEPPKLLLTGVEPLPDEQVSAIYAIINGNTYTCEAEVCEIPLQSTPLDGTTVEFWAESSFGDESEHFTALVRVLESGVSNTPTGGGWYVDVISTQWQGGPVETCAEIWGAFPPTGGPPLWLSSPDNVILLGSDEPYQYLAGRLIANGVVDAADCPANGLLPNGYADACGLSKARPVVDSWQNQFDPTILSVAGDIGLPAQLLKNLFAQESQFWPGVFRVQREYGLGQITDMGADTVLLWNDAIFKEFCPLVLERNACAKGYLRLTEPERAILRGAFAVQSNADCSDCPSGVDRPYADATVRYYAEGLVANCSQVGQTIFNATLTRPGMVSNYEDLWKFTLANYNAGPGCLAFAIFSTWSLREPMNWENVSSHLTAPCQGVISYVDLITK
jgi:hypothetical protein